MHAKNRTLVALMIVFAVSFYAFAQEKQDAKAQDVPSAEVLSKLDALLQERRETLSSAHQATMQRYQAGLCLLHEVLEAEAELANAELELVSNITARQVIHERRIKALRQLEKSVAKRVESGTGEVSQLYQAKAARLQAEIDMLRDTKN